MKATETCVLWELKLIDIWILISIEIKVCHYVSEFRTPKTSSLFVCVGFRHVTLLLLTPLVGLNLCATSKVRTANINLNFRECLSCKSFFREERFSYFKLSLQFSQLHPECVAGPTGTGKHPPRSRKIVNRK